MPASGRGFAFAKQGNLCATYGVAIMNGRRYGCININDMYKNDVGKGRKYAYEAYEVKNRVELVRVPFYFINLVPTSLVYISILLTAHFHAT